MKKATSQHFAHIELAKIEPSIYQRPTKSAQVESIIENFDEARLGTLTVSRRDGRYYAIDGQHRLLALRTLGYTHAICEILTGLTKEQESEYFRRQKENSRALRPLDLYKAGLIAKDEKCLQIDEIINDHSFQIGFDHNDFYQIGAIQALFTIVDDYGFVVFDNTLYFLIQTWAGIPAAVYSESLLGVAEFINRYGDAAFSGRLFGCFAAVWHEYREVVRKTTSSQKARKHFCRILVDFYNKGLARNSKKRLAWED